MLATAPREVEIRTPEGVVRLDPDADALLVDMLVSLLAQQAPVRALSSDAVGQVTIDFSPHQIKSHLRTSGPVVKRRRRE